MDKTGELNILENLERKMGVLGGSSCLMSLNMMSLSLTIDICRTARYFELLLDQWQECLPLGHARDVNFSSWGGKIWDMMKEVQRVFSLHCACPLRDYFVITFMILVVPSAIVSRTIFSPRCSVPT